jgi:hypothetical protein
MGVTGAEASAPAGDEAAPMPRPPVVAARGPMGAAVRGPAGAAVRGPMGGGAAFGRGDLG